MAHKLNIKVPTKQPKQTALLDPFGYKIKGFDKPVGWWKVTTEGDCEGRTTSELGKFYGHVAEIAFHLAAKCYYGLDFYPIESLAVNLVTPKKSPQYIATGKSTNIRVYNTQDIKKLTEWFDCPQVTIKPCRFYGCVTIELNA